MPTLLLLVLAASPADPPNEESWERLDREIAEYSDAVSRPNDVWITGFLRPGVVYAGEDLRDEGDNGPRGARLRNARVGLAGDFGDHSFLITADVDQNDDLVLEDAFARFDLGNRVDVTGGQFKEPFLHSGMVSEERLVMVKRTINGDETDDRDVGVMVRAGSGPIRIYGAAQNSVDGAGDDLLYTGRLTLDLAGSAFRKNEGSFGSDDDLRHATVGVSWSDDQAVSGDRLGIDFGLLVGNLGFYFDMVRYDRDYDLNSLKMPRGLDLANVSTVLDPAGSGLFVPANKADTRPYSLTASAVFGDGAVELAGRFENLDDGQNTERMSAGFTWFPNRSDAVRWQVMYLDQDSDGMDSRLSGKLVELVLIVDLDARRE